MTPKLPFLILVWIAITALSFSVISDFWLPMIIGAAAVTCLVRFASAPRR